jgi:ParB-like chromosome segregation protein Spo0J
MIRQPLSDINWIHRDLLIPNDYNPNSMGKLELALLSTSIAEDGWTQPIVATRDYIIVDGFHRWTVSLEARIFNQTNGLVPVVFIDGHKEALKMATIRHNRARGTHGIAAMAEIVADLSTLYTTKQLAELLGMSKEEVTRLKDNLTAIKKIGEYNSFSSAQDLTI